MIQYVRFVQYVQDVRGSIVVIKPTPIVQFVYIKPNFCGRISPKLVKERKADRRTSIFQYFGSFIYRRVQACLFIMRTTTTENTMAQKGHPKGLYVLFATEMWERFNYYGMRAILILFMTKALLFSDAFASNLYGSYTGLVYLTPLIGGYIADRYWGNKTSRIV